MSNSNPTLLRLFGRSRYVKHYRPPEEDDKSKKAKQDRQERERWVVAALGHVLTYDREFQEEFWRCVCCEDGNESPCDIKVTVEPKNSADLCLTASWENRHIVCVIEAKVGAPLAPHQDPDNKKAFLSDKIGMKPKGYGKALQDGSINSQSKLRYVVLGHQDELGKNPLDTQPPIQVLQHSWSSVANITPQSKWVQDLFDTLAAIGIPNFAMKYLENVNITEGLQAAHAVAILVGLCDSFGIRASKREIAPHCVSPEDYCLGIYIKPKKKGKASSTHQKLLRATKVSNSERPVWFGYGIGDDHAPIRGVWFYTDTFQTAQTIAKLLKDNGNSEQAIVTGYEDDDRKSTPYTSITERTGGKPSDIIFFKNILELVAGIAKK